MIVDILIVNGKIEDICTLKYKGSKRDSKIPDSKYIQTNESDMIIGDTWDSINKISLKDAPKRFEIPPKTELELLQEKYNDLETRLKIIEEK